MKKIAVIMNTDKVGGAERSLIIQLKYCHNVEFKFFIPKVSKSTDLENYIADNLIAEIEYFDYPVWVYSLSRNGDSSLLFFVLGCLKILLKCRFDLNGVDTVYLNGNKAAFFYFLSSYFKNHRKVIWHWRDYFSQSKVLKFLWKLLIKNKMDHITIVCNSNSVATNLKESFSNTLKHEVIYNPSGLKINKNQKEKFETIGLVSMLTPWKGVHEVYFFAWFYQSELKDLGVKKIKLFGDNVYETKGEHSDYKNELKKMITKMPTDLIEFAGLKNPETIFSEIDCLIHYSTRAEPFGRVVVEAFSSKVPVITTGIGGAGEIVSDNETGLKTILFDRRDLLEKITLLSKSEIREKITSNALLKVKNMEDEIEQKMKQLLES